MSAPTAASDPSFTHSGEFESSLSWSGITDQPAGAAGVVGPLRRARAARDRRVGAPARRRRARRRDRRRRSVPGARRRHRDRAFARRHDGRAAIRAARCCAPSPSSPRPTPSPPTSRARPRPSTCRSTSPTRRRSTRRAPLLIVPDVIRTCRDRLAAHASPEDRGRIDAVATLFDHVLSDDRIATGLRNTLARLQLPVLRMALADDAFFASRSHPTRRLLDRLAAAAAGWQDDTPNAHAGRVALERVVHTAIRGSFEDAGRARAAARASSSGRSPTSRRRAPAPAPVPDAEDRDVLVIRTTIQISQLLAGIDVDRAIRFFLLDVWSRVLVEIACRAPDAGRDALLARAKRLCFDLAWTAAPKTTSGERARLAGLLPTMVAAIRDGLRDDRLSRGRRARVLRGLGPRAARRPSAARPARRSARATRASTRLTIDTFAQRLRNGSFGPESMLNLLPPATGFGPAAKTAVDAARSRDECRGAGDTDAAADRRRGPEEGRVVRAAHPRAERRVRADAAVVDQPAAVVLPVHRRRQRADAVARPADDPQARRPVATCGARPVARTTDAPPGVAHAIRFATSSSITSVAPPPIDCTRASRDIRSTAVSRM